MIQNALIFLGTVIVGILASVKLFQPEKPSQEVIQEKSTSILSEAKLEVNQLQKEVEKKLEETQRDTEASEKTFQEFLKKIEESIESKE